MTESQSVILRLEKLEVAYHKVQTAIQGVSMEVRKGQIVALLGNNGAGKTTTLRAISGFIGLDNADVTDGKVIFKGQKINGLPPHRITSMGIVLVPERDKIFETLTVEENLDVSIPARLADEKHHHSREMIYEYFPKLTQLRKQVAGYLSGGERQMLTIGCALACSPELLMIDELSQGLAPLIVKDLMERLRTIRRDLGISVLLVEQNAEIALSIADYGYVIENGRVVLDGDSEKLLNHQDIKEFYMGGGEGEFRTSYRKVKQYRRSRRWYG